MPECRQQKTLLKKLCVVGQYNTTIWTSFYPPIGPHREHFSWQGGKNFTLLVRRLPLCCIPQKYIRLYKHKDLMTTVVTEARVTRVMWCAKEIHKIDYTTVSFIPRQHRTKRLTHRLVFGLHSIQLAIKSVGDLGVRNTCFDRRLCIDWSADRLKKVAERKLECEKKVILWCYAIYA